MSYRALLLIVLLVPAALLGGAKALGLVIPVPIWGRDYVLHIPFSGEAAPTLELPPVEGPDDPSRPLVVIDAGHGGRDPGAVGEDARWTEVLDAIKLRLGVASAVFQRLITDREK